MAVSATLLGKIKDKDLIREQGLIGNEWLGRSQSGKTFNVTNPSTNEVLATLPDFTRAEIAKAIDVAHVAQKDWAARTGKERAAVLRRWYDLTIASLDDLATILTAEMGKPFAESKGEVFDAEGFQAIKQVVEAQVEEQSLPHFLSGMLYDDGVIDPRDTRTILGICLSVIANKPIVGTDRFGVFRP